MLECDIQIVKNVLEEYGDSFWQPEEEKGDGYESNSYLFTEIVTILNEQGYDLQLIHPRPRKEKDVISR